jgi:hypothetical protein
MVRKMKKKKKWVWFKGKPQWLWCFAHVLSLIAQAILRPFGIQQKQKTKNRAGSIALDDSEDLSSGDEYAEVQTQL